MFEIDFKVIHVCIWAFLKVFKDIRGYKIGNLLQKPSPLLRIQVKYLN